MKDWKKILHPVRLEIIQTLAGGKQLTSSQLSDYLPDIPHATLYRHIKYLHHIGMIIVKEENKKRGTVERIYSLAKDAESPSHEEIASMSREEHLEMFTQFISSTIQDYGKYLTKKNINLAEDRVSYRQGTYYLSNEEFDQMITELKHVYEKYRQYEPDSNRRKRKFTTIIIPDKGEGMNE
ncbi:Helix-turn-helix domain-containing protein [Gracilibacillus ureilyticus]|uniref:Helix-turn-helix domain-containing protein n=1 Tax=Gracilibacillus ureilyticus TaxID=531814 RepID=A0A1H9M6N7_9BACI|nr:helix-turn-helix domain-containing protein [Gracilibacillus ureilyticus]SER19354.1 Helix-turn-helix domain-containing protein [Gracilibacillus ureilyticus]